MLSRSLRRPVAAASLATALALLATGCASGDKPVAAVSAGSSSTAQPGQGVTVRIGYQLIPNADLVVKNQQLLEKALPGATIKWVKFDSGGDLNTAIVAGSIDLGLAGSSPVTKGLTAPLNIPYKVLWIHDVIGDNEQLVARNASGITDVKGLVGKKVGTPFGSTSHYSLLAALALAGVAPSSVKIVDLQPQDALAAWKRGDIDAAYVWTPVLAELQKDGKVLASSGELAKQGKATYDLGVVTNAFAAAHPDIVKVWVQQEDAAVSKLKANDAEAVASVGKELELTVEQATEQLKLVILLTAKEQTAAAYLGTVDKPGGLADNLLSAAQFLLTQKAIDAVPDRSVFAAGLDVKDLSGAVG
ncbi:MAG: taurine transport system substrate-binding protein [Frankiaceae bacterium]|nr:taurine transport system substrate-binding protein [Frankiaceae bacterium]